MKLPRGAQEPRGMKSPLKEFYYAKSTFYLVSDCSFGGLKPSRRNGRKRSSHREALAVLNEPCADNTDTYAWVKPGDHNKLYLIMNFNPLHEPGQGNQGLRACDGYRYQFHIGIGKSLDDRVIYRVEFKKTLNPEAAPKPTDPLGGGNELLWQLTGGTETMTVTRIAIPTRRPQPASTSWAAISLSFPTTMARKPIGLFMASGHSRVTTPAMPRAGRSASTIRRSSTPSSIR